MSTYRTSRASKVSMKNEMQLTSCCDAQANENKRNIQTHQVIRRALRHTGNTVLCPCLRPLYNVTSGRRRRERAIIRIDIVAAAAAAADLHTTASKHLQRRRRKHIVSNGFRLGQASRLRLLQGHLCIPWTISNGVNARSSSLSIRSLPWKMVDSAHSRTMIGTPVK